MLYSTFKFLLLYDHFVLYNTKNELHNVTEQQVVVPKQNDISIILGKSQFSSRSKAPAMLASPLKLLPQTIRM